MEHRTKTLCTEKKTQDERLYNLINCYLCTISRSATVLFVLRKKSVQLISVPEKSRKFQTHREADRCSLQYAGSVSCLCVQGFDSLSGGQANALRFFCAYKFAVDVKQQVNNNHKGKSIRMERHPNDCKVENVTFRCYYLPLKI